METLETGEREREREERERVCPIFLDGSWETVWRPKMQRLISFLFFL